jgi:hypothetical protein
MGDPLDDGAAIALSEPSKCWYGKWMYKWMYAKGCLSPDSAGNSSFLACTSQILVAAAGFEPATRGL